MINIYYSEEETNHEVALYKKDIKTNEIKRVKNDGSELEVIGSKSENADCRGVQIIGDFLYYAVYVDGNADTATEMDLMKMSLKTLEKSKLATVDSGEIISINNNGTIETYVKPYNTSNWIFTNIIQSKEDDDFDIFNPNRKLTVGEAVELAYYRVGSDITESVLTDHEGRECLLVRYNMRTGGVYFMFIDLNSGEVVLDFDSKWAKYTKTKEELEIGTAYGWEYSY